MQNVHKVLNLFSSEEIEEIDKSLSLPRGMEMVFHEYGRLIYSVPLSDKLLKSVKDKAELLLNTKLDDIRYVFVDYSSKYGEPNLPPHFDGDNNSVIVDYQYRSNTSWGLGIDTSFFNMEDNSALIFNPNEYPHWRPHKTFKDGEYITMIFFRFPSLEKDYSHLRKDIGDKIFVEAATARDKFS